MSASLSNIAGRAPREIELWPIIAVLGTVVALAIGLAFGVPTVESRVTGAFAMGLVAMTWATAWPRAALRAMIFSVFLLIAWIVFGTRSINLIDVFMGPVILAALVSGARQQVRLEDLGLEGAQHESIREATGKLRRAVALFYTCAVLSLIGMAFRGHADWAADSALLLFRGFQGLVFFALGIWWLRTEAHVRGAVTAIEAAGWALLSLNVFYFFTSHIQRAGMTWLVNFPDWPMTSPNEAAVSLVMIWALLSSVPKSARRARHSLLKLGLLPLLIMTQSRSGLLAWAFYVLLSSNWGRWRTLLAIPITAIGAATLIPASYWQRLVETAALKGGSFNAYSSLMRFYSWQSAMRSFVHHPIFGVGYLGFRFISADYNELHAFVGTESYYFEVAAGMGIVGLVLLARVIVSLFRLGATVRDATSTGTFGHELARRHGPLMVALLVANITGDNFIGMVGLGQIAIWCAILVRSGHVSVSPSRV